MPHAASLGGDVGLSSGLLSARSLGVPPRPRQRLAARPAHVWPVSGEDGVSDRKIVQTGPADFALARVKSRAATCKDPDRTRRACRHRGVVVDIEHRQITCGRCETVLDPVVVVHDWATRLDRWDWEEGQASKEAEKINRVLTDFVQSGGTVRITKSRVAATRPGGQAVTSQASGGVQARLEAVVRALRWKKNGPWSGKGGA